MRGSPATSAFAIVIFMILREFFVQGTHQHKNSVEFQGCCAKPPVGERARVRGNQQIRCRRTQRASPLVPPHPPNASHWSLPHPRGKRVLGQTFRGRASGAMRHDRSDSRCRTELSKWCQRVFLRGPGRKICVRRSVDHMACRDRRYCVIPAPSDCQSTRC